MTHPAVSVIIPSHNYGRFLKESLESIFTQTFGDLEAIVVDDGSTDETPGVLASITDPRLKSYFISRCTISEARNFALERASGEYIAFLDADDRWRPEKLERQVAFLRREPSVGTVFSNFVRFNEKGILPSDQLNFYPELRSVPARDSADGTGQVILDDPSS